MLGHQRQRQRPKFAPVDQGQPIVDHRAGAVLTQR